MIQRHHIVRQHNMVVGEFSLADRFDDEMKRSTRTAKIVMADLYDTRRNTPQAIGSNLLPPLIEAAVIHWQDRVFTITGFERVPAGVTAECSYRQSWLIRIPTTAEEATLRSGNAQVALP